MTQFNSTKLVLLLCGLLLLAGCATTPVVYSDFDERHDFTQNKTFSWIQDPPMLRAGTYPVSGIAEMRMTNAIKKVMVDKGYTFVERVDNADLGLVYTMGARDEIELARGSSDFYMHRRDWGWGAYYYPYFVHFPYDRYRGYYEYPRIYRKGTIAVDVFDGESKQPIWHSKASKRLSEKDLDSHAQNADEIAAKLLQHFPNIGCEVEVTPQCQPF